MNKQLTKIENHYPLSQLSDLSESVKRALEYIEENFDKWTTEGKEITIQDAAAHLKIRASSLKKEIQRELVQHDIQITSTDYIDGLRVKKAKELFQSNPHLPSKEIAVRVGTEDRNFRKIFKIFEGKTHSEYRFEIFEETTRLKEVTY
jgi:YesN/AraC family two-component response regulator